MVVVVDGFIGATVGGLKVTSGSSGLSGSTGSGSSYGLCSCGGSVIISDVPEPGAARTVLIVERRGCLPSPHLEIVRLY